MSCVTNKPSQPQLNLNGKILENNPHAKKFVTMSNHKLKYKTKVLNKSKLINKKESNQNNQVLKYSFKSGDSSSTSCISITSSSTKKSINRKLKYSKSETNMLRLNKKNADDFTYSFNDSNKSSSLMSSDEFDETNSSSCEDVQSTTISIRTISSSSSHSSNNSIVFDDSKMRCNIGYLNNMDDSSEQLFSTDEVINQYFNGTFKKIADIDPVELNRKFVCSTPKSSIDLNVSYNLNNSYSLVEADVSSLHQHNFLLDTLNLDKFDSYNSALFEANKPKKKNVEKTLNNETIENFINEIGLEKTPEKKQAKPDNKTNNRDLLREFVIKAATSRTTNLVCAPKKLRPNERVDKPDLLLEFLRKHASTKC